ncbi:PilZ domain-containing protein [Vibrio sp. ZSDE26]|uniref:PilZ domain-containing protein n=1 Tax=Vibrio amylolyticus TaxID=2847292 RepID=A0A9X2BIX9_9VIBR|nr:PilZ domain-containing protein [Vibrio amylolyticus]MCK6262912.1 PilZ domain-containing protein [Vibrio amylolyticus]
MGEDSIQKREYYRLKYPKRARPVMQIQDAFYHVSEVSEKGIRFIIDDPNTVHHGLSMSGVLSLHDDTVICVEGAVLRLDQNEVIVLLSKGPSFKDMVQEQRHVRQEYPAYYAKMRECLA